MRPLLPALLLATLLAPFAQAAGRCDYEARLADPEALELTVQARCAGVALPGFSLGRGSVRSAREDLEIAADGLAVRYRIRLADLANRSGSTDIATKAGEMVVSPVPIWLIEPEDPDATVTLRLDVADGLDAALPLAKQDGRYRFTVQDIPFGGFAAFGRFVRAEAAVGPAAVTIVHAPGQIAMDGAELAAAIAEAGREVARYYGRFPVDRALLVALPGGPGRGLGFGQVRAGGGAAVMVRIGRQASREALRGEWVLVHELVHLGGPFMYRRAAWVMEGMATYIEPIIRTRAGWRRAEELWDEFLSEMPRGIDALTRESLNQVSFRGVYWGGALFMLLADLDIRDRSGGRASLETCLRAVLDSGGNTLARWPQERFFSVCDGATGTGTMRRLLDSYATQPGELDLLALWRGLGVVRMNGRIVFDETAPRAHLRRAITTGPAGG